MPGVRVFFKRKVVSINFHNKVMTVTDVETEQDSQISFHLCVGADGSYSVVRRQLMRVVRYVGYVFPHGSGVSRRGRLPGVVLI